MAGVTHAKTLFAKKPVFALLNHCCNQSPRFLAWPVFRNVSGIFVVQIFEDVAGDFPGRFFPTKKKREYIPQQNPQEGIQWLENRNPQKHVFC